jgi:hypothetical protein
MKPILNTEEKIGKTVGRRVALHDAFRFGMGMQQAAIELERAMRRSLCPKGVFRFRTHEEADEWMVKMLARRARMSSFVNCRVSVARCMFSSFQPPVIKHKGTKKSGIKRLLECRISLCLCVFEFYASRSNRAE